MRDWPREYLLINYYIDVVQYIKKLYTHIITYNLEFLSFIQLFLLISSLLIFCTQPNLNVND